MTHNELELVSFILDDQPYVVEALMVKEILKVPMINKLTNVASYLKGMISLR
mgnify:CR=1 FL=1